MRLAAAVICLALLAGLTVTVGSGVTSSFDLGVNAAFAPYRAPWLLAAFLWLTALGTGICQLGIATAASALLWSFGRARLALPLWTAFLGAEATTWAMKFIVDRPRPAFLPGVATAASPSFPSAHATASMAVIGMLAILVATQRPDRRTLVALAGAALIGLIGLSRVVLNVHYPTDVLGGWLVGGLWLLIGGAMLKRIGPDGRSGPPQR